jgi:hypothetical protein
MTRDIMERGRIATWSKEQLEKLSTPELRALLVNAERLGEAEVAALCNELLDSRPRGRPPVRRDKHSGSGRRLVPRGKAFEKHGVVPANRVSSRGGVRADGAVVFVLRADEVHKSAGPDCYLLWAPNIANSHPWSDTAGGKERLQHCRLALERGVAEGLLIFGRPASGAPRKDNGSLADLVDAGQVLNLTVEKRGEEYWGICASQKRVAAVTHE